MNRMAKNPKNKSEPESDKKPAGNEKYRYCYLPRKQADELQVFADKKQRSLSFMVQRAVDRYLEELRKTQLGVANDD